MSKWLDQVAERFFCISTLIASETVTINLCCRHEAEAEEDGPQKVCLLSLTRPYT